MDRNNFRIIVENDKDVLAEKSGGGKQRGEMQFDELRLATVEIFNDWLNQGKISRGDELKVLGTHLYKGLFCEKVAEFFEEAYRDVQGSKNPLCVQLHFLGRDERLSRLPWEYLYHPGIDSFWLATRTNLVLARHMPRNTTNIRKGKHDPLCILIVTSEPTDLAQIGVQQMIEAIEEVAEESGSRVHKLDEPTMENFQKRILEIKPDVLHFIGHGGLKAGKAKGEIALLDSDKKAAWYSDSTFAEFFPSGLCPRLVFLHLCESASSSPDTFIANFAVLAPKLLATNVQAVVAMQHPMMANPAIKFCQTLYRNLARGRPVTNAVQEGRDRIAKESNYESRVFGTPVLFMDNSDGIIRQIKLASGTRKQATRALSFS